MAAIDLEEDAVATLVAAVGVSTERAQQLLEAVGGSVERAADLHFSQEADTVPLPTKTTQPLQGRTPASPPGTADPEAKRRRTSGAAGKSSAQPGRGASGSGSGSGSAKGTPSRTLTAFFGRCAGVDRAPEAHPEGVLATEDSVEEVPDTTSFGPEQAISESRGGAVSSTARPAPPNLTDETAGFFMPQAAKSTETGQQSMPYSHLSAAFARLCATTKRKEKDAILQETFSAILKQAPEDLVPAVYLSSNKLGPPWEDLDLGVGGSAIGSAMSAATGASGKEMGALWKVYGDAGDVAAAVRAKQRLLLKPETLTVRRVYDTLLSLCSMTGEGCTSRRVRAMAGLIRAAQDAEETRFLVRTFACHIRTQATLTTVKDAAVAAILQHRANTGVTPRDPPLQEVQHLARECFTACPDVQRVLEPLLHGGINAMRDACAFSIGTPMKPMLARAETSVLGVLRAVGSGALSCEHKYDGQRAQIHRDAAGRVRLFSRHLENMTPKFPDLVSALGTACLGKHGQPRPFVLDAEVVAVSPPGQADAIPVAGVGEEPSAGPGAGPGRGGPSSGSGLRSDAFQRLSTRKRKDVTVGSIQVKVKVFAFDLLYLDDQNLIGRPFRERRRLLHESFEQAESFEFATFTDVDAVELAETTGDAAEDSRQELVQQALEKSLVESCEGLMCKMLDSSYEPSDGSKRSPAWLKLKADYIEGMGDSLDLVPIGGWHGMGRKAKWISPFLLACWDPVTESLQSVCRVMTGFTDAFYKEKTAFYLGDETEEGVAGDDDDAEASAFEVPRRRDGPDPRVVTGEAPPLWFEPSEVWEIRGASLSLSPKHKAAFGLEHPDRGLSMRFPRFIRTRPDKAIHEATSAAQLVEIFRNQSARAAPSAPAGPEGENSEGGSDG